MHPRRCLRRGPTPRIWEASSPWRPATPLRAKANGTTYFIFLRSGFVHSTIQRSIRLTEFLLEIFGPGAIFGEGPAFADSPRPTTTRAVAPAILSRYRPADVAQQFSGASRTRDLVDPAARLQESHDRHQACRGGLGGAQGARSSICLLRDGTPAIGAGIKKQLTVDLTHEQIGAMTALSRVTVTRTLNALAGHGLIETRARQVSIPNAPALRRFRDASP